MGASRALLEGKYLFNIVDQCEDLTPYKLVILADFNRTVEHFCSHQHTPNNPGADRPAAVLTENTGYIAWNVFTDYAKMGEYRTKELILHMVGALIGDKRSALVKNLPDRGVLTYTYQESENRYIAHLLFAHTPIAEITLKSSRISSPFTAFSLPLMLLPNRSVYTALTARVQRSPKPIFRTSMKTAR